MADVYVKAKHTQYQFQNRKFATSVIVLAILSMLAACVTVNDQTVLSMPTARLCDFLGPNWISLPSEDAAIYRELERRDARCAKGYVTYEPPRQDQKRKPKDAKAAPSSGSGIVFNRNGNILTNQHVVDRCKKIEAVHNRTRFAARVIAQDKINDVAVLKITVKTPEFGTFRIFPRVRLAEPIMVLGYPLRGLLAEQIHATSGDVTALAGLNGDTRFLQISAPFQVGNSGGPIVDQSGLVIGIATSKLNAVAVAGVTGDIPQNVNFGLKVSTILNLLDSNQIDYSVGTKSRNLSKPDIAAKIGPTVVMVLCNID